jgi:site-specific DNA-methyltransferase (adenine-specific)
MIAMVVEGFTSPDGLVVDPFTGTGTTGVAAVRAGRRFQGFELREQFAEIARRRIGAAVGIAATE